MSIDVLVSHFIHWAGGDIGKSADQSDARATAGGSAICARSPLANARGPEPGPERIARHTSPPAQPIPDGLEAARRQLVLTRLVGGDAVPGECAKGSKPDGPAVTTRDPAAVGSVEGGSRS